MESVGRNEIAVAAAQTRFREVGQYFERGASKFSGPEIQTKLLRNWEQPNVRTIRQDVKNGGSAKRVEAWQSENVVIGS